MTGRWRTVEYPRGARSPSRRGRAAGLAAGVWLCAAACTASLGSGGPDIGVSGAASPSDDGYGREEAARRETVQSNLRALFRAEARYHADTGTYTDDIVALRGDDAGGFYPDPEVRVRIPEAHESGFSAVADWSPVECALFVGDAEPPRGYVAQAGVIGCR